jgi:hypothetical protein
MQTLKTTALAIAALATTAWAASTVQPPTKEQMDADRTAAFTEADADGSGALDADEFTSFHQILRSKMEARLFDALDADDSGGITSDELAALPGPGGGRRGGKRGGGAPF